MHFGYAVTALQRKWSLIFFGLQDETGTLFWPWMDLMNAGGPGECKCVAMYRTVNPMN